MVPLFRGSSIFESLVLSHHFRLNVTCECIKEELDDGDEVSGYICILKKDEQEGWER